MFTRVVSFTGAKDIDAGIKYTRETVAPLLHQQNGFRGLTASVDRSAGVFGVLSIWATEADRAASESAMAKTREEGLTLIGGQIRVELFEEVLVEFIKAPTLGASLLIRRVNMDPAKVDDNLDFFTREVLPELKTEPGLLALRHMVNRETGEAVIGTIWADEASMDAAAARAQERQTKAAGRVTFGEQSRREVVFIDLP